MNQYCTILTAIFPEDQDSQQQESIIDHKEPRMGMFQKNPYYRVHQKWDPWTIQIQQENQHQFFVELNQRDYFTCAVYTCISNSLISDLWTSKKTRPKTQNKTIKIFDKSEVWAVLISWTPKEGYALYYSHGKMYSQAWAHLSVHMLRTYVIPALP